LKPETVGSGKRLVENNGGAFAPPVVTGFISYLNTTIHRPSKLLIVMPVIMMIIVPVVIPVVIPIIMPVVVPIVVPIIMPVVIPIVIPVVTITVPFIAVASITAQR
jgi:hypothetical protein